ncbi:hypothetical protein LRAMOSA05205 [Lichtheimia ramosa]|uniref:Uncharacterized protein n=1 Tax=Lichtheimia ramosa TaxID=688394 RepID=A0A077WZM3_9FUNG|nr:hypothetical protein LRAMOSA05205 [Lichtheimia ramosa]
MDNKGVFSFSSDSNEYYKDQVNLLIYEGTQKHHGVQADPVVEKVRVEEDDWWHNEVESPEPLTLSTYHRQLLNQQRENQFRLASFSQYPAVLEQDNPPVNGSRE